MERCPFTAASSIEEFLNPTGSTLKVTGTFSWSKNDMGASLQVTISTLLALQQAPLEVQLTCGLSVEEVCYLKNTP